jgi:hypothetical protein
LTSRKTSLAPPDVETVEVLTERCADVLGPELDHTDPGGELHDPEIVAGEVRVQAPSEVLVEALGTIDVGDRNDDGLELQIDFSGARGEGCLLIGHPCAAHLDLRGLVVVSVIAAARTVRSGRSMAMPYGARRGATTASRPRGPGPRKIRHHAPTPGHRTKVSGDTNV